MVITTKGTHLLSFVTQTLRKG